MTHPRTSPRTVGIVLFDGVEVLDFAGPFEVFAITGQDDTPPAPFRVFTVAERRPVTAKNGLVVDPTWTFEDAPRPDILVVPGGGGRHPDGTPWGRRREMHNPAMLAYVRGAHEGTELTLGVCSGAAILANAGLLEGLPITTHHGVIDELRQLVPTATVHDHARMVDTGRVVTSGGISAGIDASLGVVARLLGEDAARATASEMEYPWTPAPAATRGADA